MKDRTYKIEEMFLSAYATKSINSKGRLNVEPPCVMRTDFQRDRDRILHSKAFRRLKNKTQVFISPAGDHYRTRLTHTLDVSQIARSIARSLSLNEDLTEAIALGHDLGHTPFGHAGERVLRELSEFGFEHNEQSLRVVEYLENDGKGLNLTQEVKNGILNHNNESRLTTLEGKAVFYADRIAYVNHDIDDAIRGGLLKSGDLPKRELDILGYSSRERINTLIIAIYDYSENKNFLDMKENVKEALLSLRKFMFDRVYVTTSSKLEEEKAFRMLSAMFNFYLHNKDKLPDFYKKMLEKHPIHRVICDYLSTMSDKYAVYIFESLFIPKSWTLSGDLK